MDSGSVLRKTESAFEWLQIAFFEKEIEINFEIFITEMRVCHLQ